MPVLVNENDPSRVLEWACNTFVGRRMVGGLNVDTGPRAREVSSVHAAIFWDRRDEVWRIQDLGSANGTAVDGAPLEPGRSVALAAKGRLAFGGSKWVLRDVDPPPAAATAGDELRIATDDLLLLPDEVKPEIVIMREKGRWRRRQYADWQDGGGTAVDNGTTVTAGGRSWALNLPSDDDLGTLRATDRALAESALTLDVPPQMENIVPTFEGRGGVLTLPTRRHHELWWLLARTRQADRAAGKDDAECGWLRSDELTRQLGLNDGNYLNVLVHRSREQLAQAGFMDYALIVERRHLAFPEMRLGVARVTVLER